MDSAAVTYYAALVNKIFGSNIDNYVKVVNVAIAIIFLVVAQYIYRFNANENYYNDKILLHMYYGFLFCLIGFVISLNWVFYEYKIKKKEKKVEVEQIESEKEKNE